MIVQKLIPHVSTFSEAVPIKYKHGDTITVGGVITEILNVSDLLPKNEEGKDQEGVYVTLDDGVGYNQIVVPTIAYETYKEQYDLQPGMIVLCEGKVFELDTTHTFKNKRGKTVTIDNHEEQTIRILSWKIEPLVDEIEEVQPPASE